MFVRPSEDEHTQLMRDLGPLPIEGVAWPMWIKLLALAVLLFIGVQIIATATSPVGKDISPYVSGSIMLCYLGLLILARFMLVSRTRITEEGIHQTWLGDRHVAWDDIVFAKFVPLVASKRLICFQARGRPVIFQAGTRELQTAFARIALVYRRR